MSTGPRSAHRGRLPRLPRIGRGTVVTTAFAAATIALAGCGGDDPTAPGDEGGPPVAAATVQATSGNRFTPATVNLTVGGTVTFAFGSVAHNVFFDNAPADAPADISAPTSNQAVTRTFPTAGQYRYDCHIHPGMTGVVVVQ